MFITLEGPEGAGKTTQQQLLAQALREEGWAVVTTREPGGVAAAETIRELVLHGSLAAETETLLFLAARAEHAHAVIRPALAAGAVVLCDRFTDSTLAYQGYGLGVDLEILRPLCAFAATGLVPDLTLLLDVDPSLGLDRRFQAAQLDLPIEVPAPATDALNKMEYRDLEFHRRVWEGYRREAEQNPGRILRVDASKSIQQVHQVIRSAALTRLKANRSGRSHAEGSP